MSIYSINPLTDARWRDFIDNHPDASIFHTSGWLEALSRTYDYEPVVYTTSAGGKELRSGQAFCRVNSWVTGKRLVSLPFSDHAALLMETQNDFQELSQLLQDGVRHNRFGYVELRPLIAPSGGTDPFGVSKLFYWHQLSLKSDLNSLFKSFHASCVQRKVRRAEREKLDYIEGRSEKLIQQFYKLLLYSRRRYGLPPQPIAWFRNLVGSLGSSLKIRLASRNGTPICGIITLCYKKTMVYKYGCSDPKYHNLGGMALLFWKSIQDAKSQGFDEFDLGRSDSEDAGLMAFKEHWGATRKLLTYSRYPVPVLQSAGVSWQLKFAKKLCGLAPAPTLATAGRFLYRHAG